MILVVQNFQRNSKIIEFYKMYSNIVQRISSWQIHYPFSIFHTAELERLTHFDILEKELEILNLIITRINKIICY